jgi:hypothetical protein
LLCLLSVLRSAAAQELTPLTYNNPGLVVDLGVGLWAWPIPCDADNDGDFDLLVSCPDQPSNGIWFFENRSGDTAADPMPVFEPARRLSPTVHYVMPSYVNGEVRVLSPGREYSAFASTGTTNSRALPVPANFHRTQGTQSKGPGVRHNQWRYTDYDGDGALDLIVGIEDWSDYGWDDAYDANGQWLNGPLHGWVYVARNEGTTAEPKYAQPQFVMCGEARLEVYGCPSPNFEDFDGDGDLDLLCGEFLNGFTYFCNDGTRTEPRYVSGQRLALRDGAPLQMELQMIVPIAFDWDRDGDLDLIVGDEDGRVAFIRNAAGPGEVSAPGAVPVFEAPRYFRQRADTLKCGALATPVGADWDGDGDLDLVSGNTAGVIEIFTNLSGPGVANPVWDAPRRLVVEGREFRIQAGPDRSIQGPAEAHWGYTTLSVALWNDDELPDIVLNSITGDVQWLPNLGPRSAPQFGSPQPLEVEWDGRQPELAWGWRKPQGRALLTQWRTTPVACDFNRDGLTDLVMLDHEGYLAFFERARSGSDLTLKAPRRAFVDAAGQPLRLNAGVAGRSGRRKLCVTDWDGDGRLDLLVNSTSADLFRQTGERDGRWVLERTETLAAQDIEGHDVSPTVVDFDSNGIPDFLGGAEDGRLYFLKNPRPRP